MDFQAPNLTYVLALPPRTPTDLTWQLLHKLDGIHWLTPKDDDELGHGRFTFAGGGTSVHQTWRVSDDGLTALKDEKSVVVLREEIPTRWLRVRADGGLLTFRSIGDGEGLLARVYRKTKEHPLATDVCEVKVVPGDDTPPAGWINPFLFGVDAFDGPKTHDGPESEFVKSLLSAPLECEPVLSPDARLRLGFLDYLDKEWQLAREPKERSDTTRKRNPLSGAERLYFMGFADRAFLALDQLGGRFFIRAHGNDPAYEWQRPSRPLSCWGNLLAARWVGRWGGVESPAGRNSDATVPASACLRSSGASIRLELSPEDLDDARRRPAALFDHLHLTEDSNPTLLVLATYLKARPNIELSNQRRAITHEPSPGASGRYSVEVKPAALIQALGEAFLRPESEVWIELALPSGLPAMTGKEVEEILGGDSLGQRWLDPWRAPAFAARLWTQSLLGQLGRSRDASSTIPFEGGWWGDWFASYFRAAWDVQIRFRSGLILDDSRLDDAYLDESVGDYRQSSIIRF
jgi:hypothetical protein